jgi:hypothetical protein
MTHFCDRYFTLGGDLAELAKWFLIAALLAAVASAIVEIINKYGASPAMRLAPGATAIKDVAEALKELITALSAAPVWLGLFGAGVLLFWVPGNAVEVCRPSTSQVPDKGANGTPVKGNQAPVSPPANSHG